jgi:hypothetical protein
MVSYFRNGREKDAIKKVGVLHPFPGKRRVARITEYDFFESTAYNPKNS